MCTFLLLRVSGGKCPAGSVRVFYLGDLGVTVREEMPGLGYFLGGNCPRGNCPGGNCPCAGVVRRGNVRGNCPGGNVPVTCSDSFPTAEYGY